MNNTIFYQQHIMWYESKMLNETLDSLQDSIQYTSLPVRLKFCLNSQTYLEKPIEGNSEDMFREFIGHPVLKEAEIIYKTDADPFYNIGDWRREEYLNDYKYTIWGESDCLIPEDYFYILSNINIEEPHLLTLASRKMWDATWAQVEHPKFKNWDYVHYNNHSHEEYSPFRNYDIINQSILNEFNNMDDIEIIKLSNVKLDGSLVGLSCGLPTPFISPEMNFVREDYCAQEFFNLKKIPQYLISNRIKGHNYQHPLKRTNTKSSREEDNYINREKENLQAMVKFLQETYNLIKI